MVRSSPSYRKPETFEGKSEEEDRPEADARLLVVTTYLVIVVCLLGGLCVSE